MFVERGYERSFEEEWREKNNVIILILISRNKWVNKKISLRKDLVILIMW